MVVLVGVHFGVVMYSVKRDSQSSKKDKAGRIFYPMQVVYREEVVG